MSKVVLLLSTDSELKEARNILKGKPWFGDKRRADWETRRSEFMSKMRNRNYEWFSQHYNVELIGGDSVTLQGTRWGEGISGHVLNGRE